MNVLRPELTAVPRYFLTPSLPAYANSRVARVIDLSSKGARIELIEPFEPGQTVFVVIVTKNGEVTVPGTILWCELESMLVDMIHDRYIAGVAFDRSSNAVDGLLDALSGQEAAIRVEDFRNFDRYRMIAPLTASFGSSAPVSVADLSIRGARITASERLGEGTGETLRFHVDEEIGTIEVFGRVVWAAPSNIPRMWNIGLLISGQDDQLRTAIHRLCVRGDARIDLDSLKRKFDTLRAQSRRRDDAQIPAPVPAQRLSDSAAS